MKHVGKMKANGAPVAIAFRTLPGDANSCLVVDTGKLEPTQHDSLMSLIESGEAQGAFELGTVLSTRRFPDGSVVLPYLHQTGVLVKVPTKNVIMTSAPQQQVPLDELNKLIAEQKGVSVEDAVTSKIDVLDDKALASKFRNQAAVMLAEAQALQKQADDLDPPAKAKVTKKTASKKAIA